MVSDLCSDPAVSLMSSEPLWAIHFEPQFPGTLKDEMNERGKAHACGELGYGRSYLCGHPSSQSASKMPMRWRIACLPGCHLHCHCGFWPPPCWMGVRGGGQLFIAFLKIGVKDAQPKSHHVNPFKVYNPLAFNTYTTLYNQHHYVVLEHVHCPGPVRPSLPIPHPLATTELCSVSMGFAHSAHFI